MKRLLRIALTTLSSSLILSACVADDFRLKRVPAETAKCPYEETREYSVAIYVKERGTAPMVNKEKIVACSGDTIRFVGENVETFAITFPDGDSPFKDPLLIGCGGKSEARITVVPEDGPKAYKYDVTVPGHPVLDPVIYIYPK